MSATFYVSVIILVHFFLVAPMEGGPVRSRIWVETAPTTTQFISG